jgi:hypothetical protein
VTPGVPGTEGPVPVPPGTPNPLAERALPGFKMSQKREWTEFLFKLWDLGAALDNSVLKNSARGLLHLIPADQSIKQELLSTCARIAARREREAEGLSNGATVDDAKKNGPCGDSSPTEPDSLDEIFFGKSPSQVLYYLEV